MSWLTMQGIRWSVAEGCQDVVPQILESSTETVKKTEITWVTRHRVGDRVFYVKRYRHGATRFRPVKYFFKSPRSRYEWRLAPELKKKGVPVVPHLAHGERWAWRGLIESAVITECPIGFAAVREVEDMRVLGTFVRQLHEAGVLHSDFHAKNLLYSAGEKKFCLVDLDKMEMLPSLGEEERFDNLVLIAARVALTKDFYDGYGGVMAARADEVAAAAKAKRRMLKARVARHWREHRENIVVRYAGGLRWLVRADAENDDLSRLLENPDTAQDRYEVQRFTNTIRAARTAYRRAYRRELLGETDTKPVAVGEKRLLGFCFWSYFVTTRSNTAK